MTREQLDQYADQIRSMSDDDLVRQVVRIGQPGNSVLTEAQLRSSQRILCSVEEFRRASEQHGSMMTRLTVVILLLAVVQAGAVVLPLTGCGTAPATVAPDINGTTSPPAPPD